MNPTGHTGGADPLSGDRPVFGPELGELPERSADEASEKQLKTGTTTVAMTAGDGVVLATDMRASGGRMVASKNVQKVEEIHPTGALTIAGSVSAAQNLISNLKAEVRLYESRRGEDMSMQALATLTGNFLRSGAFFIVSPLLGGVDDEGPQVYSLDPLGGTTEEEYAVSGSGSPYALGVLEQEYDESLSTDEARAAAVHAIESAVERDTASGNGINIAVVTDDGVEIERYKQLDDAL